MTSPLRKRSFGPLRKGQRRRREIVEAAIRGIAREGLHRCTLESVARTLGVQRAHVAYHYKTVEELWAACFEETVRVGQEHTQAYFGESENHRKILFQIVDSFFLWAEEHPDHATTQLAFYHWAEVDEGFRAQHAAVRAVALGRLAFVLQNGYALGPAEARRVALRIHAITIGALMLARSMRGQPGAPSLLVLQSEVHATILELLKQ